MDRRQTFTHATDRAYDLLRLLEPDHVPCKPGSSCGTCWDTATVIRGSQHVDSTEPGAGDRTQADATAIAEFWYQQGASAGGLVVPMMPVFDPARLA